MTMAKRPKENVSRTKQIKIDEIANKLGTTVEKLLEEYKNPDAIIKKFESGELRLLSE